MVLADSARSFLTLLVSWSGVISAFIIYVAAPCCMASLMTGSCPKLVSKMIGPLGAFGGCCESAVRTPSPSSLGIITSSKTTA